MAIVELRPLPLPSAGLLHPGAVGKLGAVVHRDTLEQLAEILSVFPLQSVKCPDNAGRGVVPHWHNNSCPCQPLRQHKQRPLGTYRTHYAVHFPVPKRFPVVNLINCVPPQFSL